MEDIKTHNVFSENPKEDELTGVVNEVPAKESGIEPHLGTCLKLDDKTIICGVSLQGRIHQQLDEGCQDFHLFSDLGDGWHLYIVSDGAGSAKASARGSRWNCITAEYLIRGLLERVDWKNREELPSELEWYQEFYAICRKVKRTIEDRTESLDEELTPKDFNATLLVLIVSPLGMLTAHVGDGRMGYKNADDEWQSLMTPHKGEEVNQTIFIMNNWDGITIPTLKMGGVSVPEVRIVKDCPKAVVILSDGCENFSWNCLQMNDETERLEDKNTPFPEFWDPIIMSVCESSEESRMADFTSFIDSSTEECRNEQDDRSLILGIYNKEHNES